MAYPCTHSSIKSLGNEGFVTRMFVKMASFLWSICKICVFNRTMMEAIIHRLISRRYTQPREGEQQRPQQWWMSHRQQWRKIRWRTCQMPCMGCRHQRMWKTSQEATSIKGMRDQRRPHPEQLQEEEVMRKLARLPLYPNARISVLRTCLAMLNLQTIFGWSDTSVSQLFT